MSCLTTIEQPSLRDQVYVSFDLLSQLPRMITSAVGEQGIIGLSLIIKEHPTIIRYHVSSITYSASCSVDAQISDRMEHRFRSNTLHDDKSGSVSARL
jgi:hypothetical protein